MNNATTSNGENGSKQAVIAVADVRLVITYPANTELPDCITRLLKGLTRKFEEWAKERTLK